MPIFDFTCRACSSAYSIVIHEGEDLDRIMCPECGSSNHRCDGYEMHSNPDLHALSLRVGALEQRINELFRAVENTEDEEEPVN